MPIAVVPAAKVEPPPSVHPCALVGSDVGGSSSTCGSGMGSEYVMLKGAPGVLLPVAAPFMFMLSMDGDGRAADAVDADADGGP